MTYVQTFEKRTCRNANIFAMTPRSSYIYRFEYLSNLIPGKRRRKRRVWRRRRRWRRKRRNRRWRKKGSGRGRGGKR